MKPARRNGGRSALLTSARRWKSPSPLLSQPVAIQRTIEPWTALLDEAREDGRLVREAREGPGRAKLVRATAGAAPGRARRPAAAGRSSGCTPIRPRPSTPLGTARRSSPPGPPRASRCASTCPPSTCSAATPKRARSTSTRPRRSPRTKPARSSTFGLTKQLRPAIYDGDTPREARADIRRKANIVLTNPDMLHVGILPNHPAWAELFANLAIVVVDEAHVYRGVFGSHVANVLRRLRRIAAAYGTTPRFLLTSATIANPVELAERLTGLQDVNLIDLDGSPAPGRRIAMLEPAADRRGARQAPLLARGGGRAARAAGARRRAPDLLHEVAQGRRGPPQARRRGPRKLRAAGSDATAPTRAGPPPAGQLEWRRLTGAELAELGGPYRAGYTSAAAPRARGAPRAAASCAR